MKPEAATPANGSSLVLKTGMDAAERSLILYLEACATDYGGRVNHVHLNDEDFIIIRRWRKQGLIKFGRIKFADVNKDGAHWVELTEAAVEAAHRERRARIARMLENRRYRRNGEGK